MECRQAALVNAALESTWAAQADLPAVDGDLVEAFEEGGKIGSYEIRRLLGEGEFATVFECSREGIEGVVAVKAINKVKVQKHNSLHKSKRNIRRVNTEVLAMRRFTHAGICQLLDVLQSTSFVYLVMEQGERDLFNFLDDFPEGCPELVVKQIARILALGLRHCHNHGIAHRDIKPENILVCGHPTEWGNLPEGGIVKLCDFGLCAVIHAGSLLNDFVGSPGFFAPELMLRRQYDGAAADMWSLGAVMVEMLLGHRYFDDLWCPPYEHLGDCDSFSRGIRDAVARVKLGCAEPPSEPVRKLLDQLLQVEPERRATIEHLCSAKWFELLRVTPEGCTSILRLTFDRDRITSFNGLRPPPALRRFAYRESPSELASISSLDSETNLKKMDGATRSNLPSSISSTDSREDDLSFLSHLLPATTTTNNGRL
ncbi:hypothetical protein CTAYLR_002585 [Chrysophaeum taylorii]|uniref:Protein kinase domain-containing protein n=1 Tax=Chrysophaeum taylorii TaxID=2483200 RepID=A0AAD7UDZ7_9STRA|nr:hypothetical protein CTAYLR_002585 [Chrysophaeum taylorii]